MIDEQKYRLRGEMAELARSYEATAGDVLDVCLWLACASLVMATKKDHATACRILREATEIACAQINRNVVDET